MLFYQLQTGRNIMNEIITQIPFVKRRGPVEFLLKLLLKNARTWQISKTLYNYASNCFVRLPLRRLSRSLKIARKVYDNCSHIFFIASYYRAPADTRDCYLSRNVPCCASTLRRISRLVTVDDCNVTIKFLVIEFIFARFIADASDSRLSLVGHDVIRAFSQG